MRKFGLALLVAAAFGFGMNGIARAGATADFGVPPSGAVPLLFNDHHVYVKPDAIVSNRLLGALVRDGSIYVPMRSMFEQMGATVVYNAEKRTAIIEKPGTLLVLRVGVKRLTLDGVERPLDVPPIVSDGIVMVPIRVISEAMGAYVAYVPQLRAVSIRYEQIAPTPAPARAPVSVSVVPPAAAPTPDVAPHVRATVGPGAPIPVSTPLPETFVIADVLIAPSVANAFSSPNGTTEGVSFDVHAASEFTIVDTPFAIDAGYTQWSYDHPAGRVDVVGLPGSSFVPEFHAEDRSIDGHVGVQVTPHKFYIAAGYTYDFNNYGYPEVGGLGFGLEKLPALDSKLSYDGSFFYYPNVSGACNASCSPGEDSFSYRKFTYSAGLTYRIERAILHAGYRGDHTYKKAGPPTDTTHGGAFAGLGLLF